MADSGTNPVRPNTFELEADVNVEFNEAASRQQINSGESVKTLFGKLRKFLTDLKAVAFSGAYGDLSGTPDLTQYASKAKYGDSTIDVGRKAGTTVGERSTAEGYNTIASGKYSTADGWLTTASGQGSKASGYNTEALGDYSCVGGFFSQSLGHSSFAYGNRAKTSKNNEVAFGSFNLSNDDTLFSVGDGKGDNGKHNAFEITTTGGKLHDKDIAVKDDISNPNLLINPDFKINQRGKSGTFSETGKYFVDRWRLASGTVTVNADGTLTLNGTISQIFENAVGDNVTASVSAGTASYDDSTKTFSITANGEIISWAKLEVGNPTLFVPPDPATELVKCKRYYRSFGTNFYLHTIGCYHHNGNNQFSYYFDIPMRVAPDVTFNDCAIRRVNDPYSEIEVTSHNSLSTKNALYFYSVMPMLYDDALFFVKSENGLELDAEIK